MLSSVIRAAPRIPLAIIRTLHSLPSPSLTGRRVLERDIKIFTVEAGKLADRVRNKPELQLHCVGGSALHSEYHPSQMQFINAGLDDEGKVNWIGRTSSLNSKVQMGTVEVAFEGWSGPGDEYVRAGSQVVRYELNWSGGGVEDNVPLIVIGVVVGSILIIYLFADVPSEVTYVWKRPQVVYQEAPPVIVKKSRPKIIYEETPYESHPRDISPKVRHHETSTPRVVFAKSRRSE